MQAPVEKLSFIYCMIHKIYVFFVISFLFIACGSQDTQDNSDNDDLPLVAAPVNLSFQIVNEYPHDTLAFTQGFSFYEGKLYEATGSPDFPVNNGTWIGEVDLKNGKVNKKIDLGNTYFGEGITFMNDKIYQLTYQTKKGFVYDAKNFKKLSEFTYKSEGWGITNDGEHLIMSTGSNNLYYLTPDSLNFVKMVAVQDNNGYVANINELEYIDGYIYANHWMTPYILKIDPSTGHVVGRFDFSKQVSEIKSRFPQADELNGIAYDSITGKTFITGKKWPVIYEIKW